MHFLSPKWQKSLSYFLQIALVPEKALATLPECVLRSFKQRDIENFLNSLHIPVTPYLFFMSLTGPSKVSSLLGQ